MKIRGKEIKFLRTVKTTIDLTEICPDKDINRIGELFNTNVADMQKNAAILIHSMNESYEMNKHLDDPDYEPNIISVDEILYLNQEDFTQLLQEAMNVFSADIKPTVETEKPKKKKKIQ